MNINKNKLFLLLILFTSATNLFGGDFEGLGDGVDVDFLRIGKMTTFFRDSYDSIRDSFLRAGLRARPSNEFIQGSVDVVNEISSKSSQAFNNFVNFIPNKINNKVDEVKGVLKKTGTKVGLATLGLIGIYYGIKLSYNYLQDKVLKPDILTLLNKKTTMIKLIQLFKKTAKQSDILIFDTILKEQLNKVINHTKITNKNIKFGYNNSCYRNILLYGPTGTGKSSFVKKLANTSNMDIAEINCIDLGKYSKKEIFVLVNKLTIWLNSQKSLILFIQNIDLLMSSNNENYKLFAAFLNYVGKRNNRFMTIFETNKKHSLDKKIYDYIDVSLKFNIPNHELRREFLGTYINELLISYNPDYIKKSVNNCLICDSIDEITSKTEGFSYSELYNLINNIKSCMNANFGGILTDCDIKSCLNDSIKLNKFKN